MFSIDEVVGLLYLLPNKHKNKQKKKKQGMLQVLIMRVAVISATSICA